MIDPLEAVIQWLKVELRVTQGRVSGKHQYGRAWQVNETGLAVYMDDGGMDLYAPIGVSRLEMRIYGASRAPISDVWNELRALERANQRFTVATSQGLALVYDFSQSTGLSFLYDDQLKMDYGVVFFDAMVAEASVS